MALKRWSIASFPDTSPVTLIENSFDREVLSLSILISNYSVEDNAIVTIKFMRGETEVSKWNIHIPVTNTPLSFTGLVSLKENERIDVVSNVRDISVLISGDTMTVPPPDIDGLLVLTTEASAPYIHFWLITDDGFTLTKQDTPLQTDVPIERFSKAGMHILGVRPGAIDPGYQLLKANAGGLFERINMTSVSTWNLTDACLLPDASAFIRSSTLEEPGIPTGHRLDNLAVVSWNWYTEILIPQGERVLSHENSGFVYETAPSSPFLRARLYNGLEANPAFGSYIDITGLTVPVVDILDVNKDGTHIIVSHAAAPFISCIKRTGSTFEVISAGLSESAKPWAARFTPTDDQLVLSYENVTSIYDIDGDTYTPVSSPLNVSLTDSMGSIFGAFGNYLYFYQTISPYQLVYERVGSTYELRAEQFNIQQAEGGKFGAVLSF